MCYILHRIRLFSHSFGLLAICLFVVALAGCKKPEEKAADFIARGNALVEKGDYNRALLEYQNAAKLTPFDAEPPYRLGITYLKMQNIRPAVVYLRKAVELNPKHTPASIALAELMTKANRKDIIELAAARANDILTTDPGNVDALNTVAIAELRLGKIEDAEKHIAEALHRYPSSLKAAATLASVKLTKKDYAGAEQVMKEAARQAPQSTDCALALAQFYTITGKLPEAEAEFRRALSIDSKNAGALYGLAVLQDHGGHFDDAEATLKQLSALPNAADTGTYGLYLFRRGKKDAAVAEFQRLAAAAPNDRQARTRLVEAYLAVNRQADAANIVSAALAKNPNDSDALIERASFLIAKGKFDDADADLRRALKTQPESVQLHFLLAQVHHHRNQTALERQELEEALRLRPTLLKGRLQLAHALTVMNEPASALDVLEGAPEPQKHFLAFVIERNMALFAAGRNSELRKSLDQSLAAVRDPMLLLQDGVFRIKQNDLNGARASLQEVLRRKPDEWRAVDALAGTYAAQNNVSAAVATVRQYTAAYPKSAAAQKLLGTWLLTTGDAAGARSALESARSSAAPADAAGIELLLSNLDVAEQKYSSAEARLKTVLDKDPSNIAAVLSLASIKERANHRDEAITLYDRIVQTDPKNVTALNNLAYLLVDTGTDKNRGLQLAQDAKQLAPDNPGIDDTIGWAYYQKGMHKTALEYLKRAATAQSTPVRKCHLAMTYIKLGETQKGMNLLQAVAKENPNVPELQTGLTMLQEAGLRR